MATVTFKTDEAKVQIYRRQAKADGLTLSEFARHKMDDTETEGKPRIAETMICEYTGARIFKRDPSYIPLTNESVKEMLADFP